MKGYLIWSACLHDGEYMTCKPNWHERLRLRLAKWLYLSVQKQDKLIVSTTASRADASLVTQRSP
mgnify:CR=1